MAVSISHTAITANDARKDVSRHRRKNGSAAPMGEYLITCAVWVLVIVSGVAVLAALVSSRSDDD